MAIVIILFGVILTAEAVWLLGPVFPRTTGNPASRES